MKKLVLENEKAIANMDSSSVESGAEQQPNDAGSPKRNGWRNAADLARQEDLSVMDALNKAGLSGSVDLARANPQSYAQSFQEALKNGTSYDQALMRATSDATMKVVGNQVPMDTLLYNIGGDPNKAVSLIHNAMTQSGIRMTPGELNLLGIVAAEASAYQQEPSFRRTVAIEMLKQDSKEAAWTAASQTLWQEATDRVIAHGIADAISRDAGRGQQVEVNGAKVKPFAPQYSVGGIDGFSDAEYNYKKMQQNQEENAQHNEDSNAHDWESLVAASPVFIHSTDDMFRRSKKVTPIPGYEDVAVHGDPIGFIFADGKGKESNIAVYEFAEMLKESGLWHGGDIRLLSCSTAADGAIAAQGLANYLGVNVLAPSDDLYMDFDGNLSIGKNNDGEWRLLKPKNRKEEKP